MALAIEARDASLASAVNMPARRLTNTYWVKRPPKTPDRAYPLVKNQEYAYAYDWEYRPG